MADSARRDDEDDDGLGQSHYDDDEEHNWDDAQDEEDDAPKDSQADIDEEAAARREQVLADADPEAVDAHRDLLAAVISSLDSEEEDLLRVAQRADVETLDPDEMSPQDLARLTYELAGSYPDVLEAVTNRFPHAEKLLRSVLEEEDAAGDE